jgi:hypothetical protein
MDAIETARLKRELGLVTVYDPKPIPPRQFDWSCTKDGYEPGDLIGYGKTEAEAVQEYIDLMEE